jgi:hypothetical protein
LFNIWALAETILRGTLLSDAVSNIFTRILPKYRLQSLI